MNTISVGKKEGFAAYARSVEKWLDELHPWLLIMLMTAATFVVSILAGAAAAVLEQVLGNVIATSSSAEDILETAGFSVFSVFWVVAVASILETLIYQHWIIRFINRFPVFRGKRSVLIVLSALAFGAVHWMPVFHVFHTFLIGLLLAYTYVLKMEQPREAFWIVKAIHAMRNLISFTFSFLMYS